MYKGKSLKDILNEETAHNILLKLEKIKYKLLIFKTKVKIIIKKLKKRALSLLKAFINNKKVKLFIEYIKENSEIVIKCANTNLYKAKKLGIKLFKKFKAECLKKFEQLKGFIKENPKSFAHICATATCVIILICTVCYWNNSQFGLVLACNGEEVATIKDEHTFEEANQKVSERLVHNENSEETSFDVAPTYKLTVTNKNSCEDSNAVCDKLIEKSKGTIEEASGLYVNDQLFGVIKDEKEINNILDDVLKSASGNKENAEASFVQEVKSVNGLYPSSSVIDEEHFKNLINTPVSDEAFYTVKEGDVPGSIAESFNLSLEELEKINDNNLDALMYPGDQVKVKVAKKPLTVSVTVEESYETSIPFKTVTTEDNNEYKTFSEVTKEGIEGKQSLTDKVTYIDGLEVKRENISKNVIQEPVNKEITVGTKEQSSSSSSQGTGRSTGNLMWPVPSTRLITSGFGYRWGRLHSGIDIGASGGSSIVAADGGTVSSVSYSGSGYGNHLIINHGNGISTLYAHCSAIYVSSGSRISKGQTIAAVGSTGDSTGNHLHFEVIVGGTKVNPQSYV